MAKTNFGWTSLARWAILGAVAVLVTWATIRVSHIARCLDLTASLPARAHRLYDNQRQRIRTLVQPGDNPDVFVMRHLVGLDSLPEIEHVTLCGRRGRNALKMLSEFAQLRRLTLEYITIDETVISDLEKLPKLTKLNFASCTMSDDDLRAMRQRLPNCTVQTENNGQSLTAEQRRIAESELSFAQ